MKEMDEQTTNLLQEILSTCDDLMEKINTVRAGQKFLKSAEVFSDILPEEAREKHRTTYKEGEEILGRLQTFYSLETGIGNLLLQMYDAKLGYSEKDRKHIIISA